MSVMYPILSGSTNVHPSQKLLTPTRSTQHLVLSCPRLHSKLHEEVIDRMTSAVVCHLLLRWGHCGIVGRAGSGQRARRGVPSGFQLPGFLAQPAAAAPAEATV